MEKEKSCLPFWKTLIGITCSAFAFSMSLSMLVFGPPIIIHIEIQKDYYSHPIQSMKVLRSSFNSSYSNITIESPLCFKGSTCKSKTKYLLYNEKIDLTPIEFSYYNATYESLLKSSVKKGQQCPTDYKQCGILDTLDNIMCVSKDAPCPINLIIMDKNEIPPKEYTDKYRFTSIRLNSLYIHFTNEAIDNQILAKFVYYGADSLETFPYERNEFDDFDSIKYEECDITQLNSIFFTKYSMITQEYSYRPYIGTKPQCLPSDFYIENFYKTLSNRTYQHIIFFILSLSLFIEITIGVCFDYDDFIEEPTKEKNRNFIICFIVFAIICIPALIYNILSVIDNFNLEMKDNCYDEDTNKMIKLLYKDIELFNFIFGIVSLGSLIILLLFFIFCAIFIIRTANRKMLEIERDRQEQLMNIPPTKQKTPNSSIPLYPINN